MSILYPSQSSIRDAFAPAFTATSPQSITPLRSRPTKPRYIAWSASEKAASLSEEAQAELKKASAATQAKTGQIELYSGKFYAACILGGLLACVNNSRIGSILRSMLICRHRERPTQLSLLSTWSSAAAKSIPISTKVTLRPGARSVAPKG